MSASNPTKAELAALLAQANERLAQFSTPTAVAEATEVKSESASDKLKAHVESQGKLFARGGRTIWSLKNLQAAVNVLKTGEPTIVPVEGLGTLAKRGVSGIAIGVGDDGKSVLTQNVYTPEV